jgi:exonuclease 3'-5' domain-containing protein 2
MIFDNCLIQAPDGVNLSRCGRKKLNWYLNRGMAELVADSPPTIRLKFEPSGRQGINDPLLLEGKPNLCVVCGATENLTRHHIVPYSFIRHMDVKYKVDIIRDIFPLCRPCHDAYEEKSYEKRLAMADAMGVSITGVNPDEMRRVRQAMGAATAVAKHGDRMPVARRAELSQQVREFLGLGDGVELTPADLQRARTYRVSESEGFVSFSRHVAEGVTDYSEFAREWRLHFVETMNPRFMPTKWRVDRKTDIVWVPLRMQNQRRA